jgi:hypothetical protein
MLKSIVLDEADCFGNCDTNKQIIAISLNVGGKPTSYDQQFATFIHEFMHAAMHTLGMEDNEQLAAGMEQMFLQLFKTGRWKKS